MSKLTRQLKKERKEKIYRKVDFEERENRRKAALFSFISVIVFIALVAFSVIFVIISKNNEEPVPETTTQTESTEPPENYKYIVMLDPAHGFDDSGKEFDGFAESQKTLSVCMNVQSKGIEGVKFIITRNEDERKTSFPDKERANYINSFDCDFCISLHFDTKESAVYSLVTENTRLSQKLAQNMGDATDIENDSELLNSLSCPAAILTLDEKLTITEASERIISGIERYISWIEANGADS